MMTQTGQISRHFLRSHYQNVDPIPEEDIHNRSVAIPDIAEQMEINTSAVMQVGHQLAIIGDECNRTYNRKLKDSLFCLVKGIAAGALQTCGWRNVKSVMKSFGSFFNSGWRKKIIEYGCWMLWLPLRYVCQKWMSATLFGILMWWLVTYELQN